jgi:ABC-type Na+ efflux pump permease subunit
MREKLRKPSPALVLSVVAIVLALAGTGVASVATISALSKKEKKQTRNIADSEVNKLAPGLSVANSANSANSGKLGGIDPSGYIQGSGHLVPVRAYVDSGGATATLFNATGVGTVTVDCANTGDDVTLTYTNTSGATQLVSRSFTLDTGTSTVDSRGNTVAANSTQAATASQAGPSNGHMWTIDAVPIAATGAPGLTFRGSAWTSAQGQNRCVVYGVVHFG